MDKKTMIKALAVCGCGFALFISLALFVAFDKGEKADDIGVIPEGKSVEFSANSPSDVENPADSENSVKADNLPTPSDDKIVRVSDYIPDIRVDLRYATKNNFTGKKIYNFNDAYLRYGTVKKMLKAQTKLKKYGVGLEIWDAFRPVDAQFKLWEICPNPTYVSDPNKGYSSHSRGNAVDVTLVDSDGTELLMPTGFDNFTKLADRDYNDIDDEFARENAKLLEKTMKECGFEAYSEEWWHFSDTTEYEVSKDFTP